jgi:hypothetical protein
MMLLLLQMKLFTYACTNKITFYIIQLYYNQIYYYISFYISTPDILNIELIYKDSYYVFTRYSAWKTKLV